ncbi:MAG TPA: CARDB domain-containing protein, partial [Anaerolineae bacterium]|nr:CARDB domain-containing protein [Anaerolineae bacterium]
TTYTVYVNGAVVQTTGELAGKKPAPAQQVDVGRGAGAGGTCSNLAVLTFVANTWNTRGYQVKVDGNVVWSDLPTVGTAYPVAGLPIYFCNSIQLEVLRHVLNGSTLQTQSLGTYTLGAAAGSGYHDFVSGGYSTTLLWSVTAASAARFFQGRLDDVRLWARDLSAVEVQALAAGGYRSAHLAPGGDGAPVAQWTASVPAGLEGAYRLDLRGQDAVGHSGPANLAAWQGDVDTLGPRVALTRTLQSDGAIHYLTTAQDFNLTQTGFNSPCGAGVITQRQNYDTPWYRAIFGSAERLNTLVADCTLPGFVTSSEVGAYDTAGLAQSIAVTGTLAVVADGAAGVQIVDVSQPTNPTLLSNLAGFTSARGVALVAYPVTAGAAVQRLDSQAPTPQPVPMATVTSTAALATPQPIPTATATPTPASGAAEPPPVVAVPAIRPESPSQATLGAAPISPPPQPAGTPLASSIRRGGSKSLAAISSLREPAKSAEQAPLGVALHNGSAGAPGTVAGRAAPSAAMPILLASSSARSSGVVNSLNAASTTIVSMSTEGAQGNADAGTAAISADGQYVAFESSAANLVSGDTNGAWDVFVRDTVLGTTERVSVASDGAQANGGSSLAGISADGRYVAFSSIATNLVPDDTNGTDDLFVHDRDSGQTRRVSLKWDGSQAASVYPDHTQAALSTDGQRVVYSSWASDLVENDTNGMADIFLYDAAATAPTRRVSVGLGGAEANNRSSDASISGDGRYIAFTSYASNLVADDTNGRPDIFVYDTFLGSTERVSVSSAGVEANGDSASATLSADGRWVAFDSSATNLAEEDSDSDTDVFLHDHLTSATYAVNPPDDLGYWFYYPSLSADGRFIAFLSDVEFFADNTSENHGSTKWEDDLFAYDRQTGAFEWLSAVLAGYETYNSYLFTGTGGVLSQDGSRAVFYADEDNLVLPDSNARTTDVFLRQRDVVTPTIDLVVDSITVRPSNALALDQPFEVAVRVRNAGETAAHSLAHVYLDPAAAPTACVLGAGRWASAEMVSLAAGETYTITQQHIGFASAGAHTLYVQADSACELDEADESNNISGPVSFTVEDRAYSPDLVVSALTVEPASPQPGQTITYRVTVANQGTDAVLDFPVGVYLTSSAPAACDPNVHVAAQVTSLAAGATTTLEIVDVLGLDAGSHAVYAQADSGCTVTETDEANNTFGPASFDVAGERVYPDLVIEQMIAPSDVLDYLPFDITTTVRNAGAGGAALSYLDFDDWEMSCWGGWGADVEVGPLTAGAVQTLTYHNTDGYYLGWSANMATEELYGKADAYCEVDEMDEANNAAGPIAVTVRKFLPDLIVESVTTDPLAPGPNEPFDLVVMVKNQGVAGAGGDQREFEVWIHECQPFTSGCWQSSQMFTDYLMPGETAPVRFSHPGFPYGGEWQFYGDANSNWWLTELDRENSRFGPVTITIGGPTPTPTHTPTFTPTPTHTPTPTITPTPTNTPTATNTPTVTPTHTPTSTPTPVAPDLVITSLVVVPTIVVANQGIINQIRVTVKNQSTTQWMVGNASVGIYVDRMPAGDCGATPPDDGFGFAGLAPGQSFTGLSHYTFGPFSTAGEHFVYAVADNYCDILETNENNNTAQQPFQVVQADLTVTDLNVSPAIPLVGQPVTFTMVVKNVGTWRSSAAWSGVYIDKATFTNTDCGTPGDQIEQVPGLDPGQSYTMTLRYWSPTLPKTYTALGRADYLCMIDEITRDNNNSDLLSFQAQWAGPDLVVDSITTDPAAPRVSAPVTFTLRVRNAGNIASPSGGQIGLYLNGNTYTGGCPGPTPDYAPNIPALGVGESRDLVVRTSGFTTGGNNLVEAVADWRCDIEELNDLNNYVNTMVSVNPSILPELTIASITANPTSPPAGDPITYTVRVSNTGAAASPAGTKLGLYIGLDNEPDPY